MRACLYEGWIVDGWDGMPLVWFGWDLSFCFAGRVGERGLFGVMWCGHWCYREGIVGRRDLRIIDYRKISGITNSPGLVVRWNRILRLTESLRTGPDNVTKRLWTPSWATRSSENCCTTSPDEFVISGVLRYGAIVGVAANTAGGYSTVLVIFRSL